MPQDSKTSGEVLPEEIWELERLLEEKKRALAERGEERAPREAFREAFREKYGEAFKPAAKPAGGPVATLPEPQKTPREEDGRIKHEDEVQSLVMVAFEKGIRSAAEAAKRESPWLLDELHDRLIDEYYEKLVEARKIEEAS